MLLPTHEIVILPGPLPPGSFGALLVTSANAAPFLAANRPPPGCPVLAVGAASARALRLAGIGAKEAGDGTGAGLAIEASALHRGTGLPLLYVAGRVRTDGLEAALDAARVPFETVEAYDTRAVPITRERLEAALGADGADAVLLLSLGQARAFEALRARFPDLLDPAPRPLCLSGRIAEALRPDLAARAIVADRPELSGLLASYRAGFGPD